MSHRLLHNLHIFFKEMNTPYGTVWKFCRNYPIFRQLKGPKGVLRKKQKLKIIDYVMHVPHKF